MKVLFEIDLPSGKTLTESDLEKDKSRVYKMISTLAEPQGGLVIKDAASGQSTVITDTLLPLISKFCFESVTLLGSEKPFATSLVSWPEKVAFTPKGKFIDITGDEVEPSRYPTETLIPALIACGGRYIQLLTALYEKDPTWSARLTEIKNLQAKAQKVSSK